MKTNAMGGTSRQAGSWRQLMGLVATVAMLASVAMGGNPELPLDLGTAGGFVIFAKTGISTVPSSDITGDMGVSPIDSTAITGFSLIMDISGEFSTSAQVVGNIYAADYISPTPNVMITAISDMETAFTQASLRTIPDTTEFMAGNISGQTITPGLHKWSTDVLINSDVTLDGQGNADSIFIFQISGDLLVASGRSVLLAAGAQAKNIFWQIEGPVGAVVGTTAHVEGVVMTAKAITIQTGASFNGKLLAQTRVDLDQNVIVDSTLIPPPQVILEIVSEHGVGNLPVGIYTNDFGTILTNTVTGTETLGGTQYVNTGWSMIGNDPALGTTNTMTMVHTNDAVLTWLWDTNYLLNATAGPGGSATGDSNGFYAAGANVTVTAVPNPGYTFDHWEVNGTGQGSGAQFNVSMDGERNVLAVFTPITLGVVSWNVTWRFDPRQGFYLGTLTIINPSDSPSSVDAPFWFKVQSTEWHWLRTPTGVDPISGKHYVDLSAEIRSLLAGIGNGNQILDPGESVSVGGIELMGRRTPDALAVDLQYEVVRYDFDGASDPAVYRFWSDSLMSHFFTASAAERDDIIATSSDVWTYEGVAFYVPGQAVNGSLPVHRFWSDRIRCHLFTISETEKSTLQTRYSRVFTYEGHAWYAFDSQAPGTLPVYRFWAPKSKRAFFTISEEEKNNVIATMSGTWRYEGIAWYAYASSSAASASSIDLLSMASTVSISQSFISDVGQAGELPDSVIFGLSYGADEVVSAMLYDPVANTFMQVLGPTLSPRQLVVPPLTLGQRYWLSVTSHYRDEENMSLDYGGWLGRVSEVPEEKIATVDVDEDMAIGLPVEHIVLPETDDTLALRLYSESDNSLIQTLAGIESGSTYELSVPAWNQWYRLDIVREQDGEVIESQWIGHMRTH